MASVTNDHKLNGLKQQQCILSQFRRLAVQNQGVSSPDSVSSGPQEAFSLAASQLLVGARNLWHSLACRWITPSSASVGTYGSSCVSGSPSSLLLQNDLILANYVYKGPISQ